MARCMWHKACAYRWGLIREGRFPPRSTASCEARRHEVTASSATLEPIRCGILHMKAPSVFRLHDRLSIDKELINVYESRSDGDNVMCLFSKVLWRATHPCIF
jgi:hypothetical protein